MSASNRGVIYARPCRDSRHDFVDTRFAHIDNVMLACRNCPIRITRADIQSIPPHARLDSIIRQKEREWYIRELES